MTPNFSLHRFRFHLEPKSPLHMRAYNKGSTLRLTPKGNVIRGGFGSAISGPAGLTKELTGDKVVM